MGMRSGEAWHCVVSRRLALRDRVFEVERSPVVAIASRELEPVSSADLFRHGNPRYDTNSAQLANSIISARAVLLTNRDRIHQTHKGQN